MVESNDVLIRFPRQINFGTYFQQPTTSSINQQHLAFRITEGHSLCHTCKNGAELAYQSSHLLFLALFGIAYRTLACQEPFLFEESMLRSCRGSNLADPFSESTVIIQNGHTSEEEGTVDPFSITKMIPGFIEMFVLCCLQPEVSDAFSIIWIQRIEPAPVLRRFFPLSRIGTPQTRTFPHDPIPAGCPDQLCLCIQRFCQWFSLVHTLLAFDLSLFSEY